MRKEIEIRTPFIRLGDLLKFAAMVSGGGEAKMVIAEGLVKVNGEVCTMRGKKLVSGDAVCFAGEELVVK